MWIYCFLETDYNTSKNFLKVVQNSGMKWLRWHIPDILCRNLCCYQIHMLVLCFYIMSKFTNIWVYILANYSLYSLLCSWLWDIQRNDVFHSWCDIYKLPNKNLATFIHDKIFCTVTNSCYDGLLKCTYLDSGTSLGTRISHYNGNFSRVYYII
jgi:hypothetical protein